MSDIATSIIRTIVPLLIGGVVSWLADKGINAPADVVALSTAIFAFLVGSLYYIVVRALEARWPKLGVLLGKPAKPTYSD